jgi:hypothetical protein
MSATVTDEDVQQLAATAQPFSVALLWWGPQRQRDGGEAIEREHQRRMVALRADGVIAVLCPASSDTLAGVAIMTVPADAAQALMDDDPCVLAGMIRCEAHACFGFPGDALPG